MEIDPRLNDIDDCLYRVAIRALIIKNNKVLLVSEHSGIWWFPGGGIDHGEPVQSCLTREVEEELGVSPGDMSSDFQIAHYNIGNVYNSIPRMNLFFRVHVSGEVLEKAATVTQRKWFTRDEFMKLNTNPVNHDAKLVEVIFGEQS